MTDMEDRSRRNNVRLVGLPEGAEGSDAAGFLRVNISKWIPSLRDRDIETNRAHHVYDGRKNSDRPRTLIFRVLRWHDRSEILKGARQAYPVKCAQDNVTLLFFPDFSPATTIRRKAFNPVLKKMTVTSGAGPRAVGTNCVTLVPKPGKKEAGTGEHLKNLIIQINKHKSKAAAPHRRLPHTKHKLKSRPGLSRLALSSLLLLSFQSTSVGTRDR